MCVVRAPAVACVSGVAVCGDGRCAQVPAGAARRRTEPVLIIQLRLPEVIILRAGNA